MLVWDNLGCKYRKIPEESHHLPPPKGDTAVVITFVDGLISVVVHYSLQAAVFEAMDSTREAIKELWESNLLKNTLPVKKFSLESSRDYNYDY